MSMYDACCSHLFSVEATVFIFFQRHFSMTIYLININPGGTGIHHYHHRSSTGLWWRNVDDFVEFEELEDSDRWRFSAILVWKRVNTVMTMMMIIEIWGSLAWEGKFSCPRDELHLGKKKPGLVPLISYPKEKTEMIEFYRHTKGRGNVLDQTCSSHSCGRRAKRWPLWLF